MGTFLEVMDSGDNAPNIVAGDLNSNTMLMLHRQEIEAGGPMPPTRALKDEYIQIFERWIMGGAPQTAEEAAAASAPTEAASESSTAIPESQLATPAT